MLDELYGIIVKVHEDMNKSFDLPLSQIGEETELSSLGIDSLTFVMIMLAIEQHYGISLVSDEDKPFNRVKDVMDAVSEALNKK